MLIQPHEIKRGCLFDYEITCFGLLLDLSIFIVVQDIDAAESVTFVHPILASCGSRESSLFQLVLTLSTCMVSVLTGL